MNNQKSMLQVVTHMNGDTIVEVVESREVAKVVGKDHSKLIRDIRTYEDYLTEAKIGLSDFFIENTYTDITGRTLPCYLITRKGCEMIANKMTGKKGVIFTAQYVNAFHDMEETIKVQVTKLEQMKIKAQYERATAMRMNAENRRLKLLLSNPNWKNLSDVALQTMGIKAVETVTGQDLSPLLPQCEKLYSATEVAKILGIMTNDGKKPSSNKIGTMSNKLKLKETDENNNSQYGVWVMDKSASSSKEMSNFKYNSRGVQALAEAFGVKDYNIS